MAIPSTKLAQAQALINSGRPTEALAVLRPFVPREPRNVQLASLMGLAALRAEIRDVVRGEVAEAYPRFAEEFLT